LIKNSFPVGRLFFLKTLGTIPGQKNRLFSTFLKKKLAAFFYKKNPKINSQAKWGGGGGRARFFKGWGAFLFTAGANGRGAFGFFGFGPFPQVGISGKVQVRSFFVFLMVFRPIGF